MKDDFWGQAVYRCRKQRRMSLWQASKRAGLSPIYLFLIERGRIPLRLDEFVGISKAFNTTPLFLLYEIDQIMPPRPNHKKNWLC